MSASVSSIKSGTSRSSTRGIDRVVNDYDLSAERKYPSVKDYYYASSKATDKPIQYQNGLSNFSSLQLGDDRIQFTESIMSATFKGPREDRPISPSRMKTKHLRQREYDMARAVVDDFEVDRLERVMKDKLFQRSEHVSSPFQIRKALKFFDVEKSGYIALEDFAHALEFLGFQFNEMQNMALFARYDPDVTGCIDYMTFINKAMFDDPMKPVVPHQNKPRATAPGAPKSASASPSKPSAGGAKSTSKDFTEADLKAMQEAELKRVFQLVHKSGGEGLGKDEFELLLMALGYNLSPTAVDGCYEEIFSFCADKCTAGPSKITFPAFCHWWTEKESVHLYSRK